MSYTLEFPTPPSFPLAFPETKQTQRGKMDAHDLFRAECAAREYLPADGDRPWLLRYEWRTSAGFADHCAGRIETSERPFREGDCCDGTRDDCVMYLVRAALWQLGYDEAGVHRLFARAYPGREVPDFTYLRWFSARWREYEIGPERPFDRERYAALMDSLYAMNYRKPHAVLETLTPRFPVRVSEETPGYGKAL